MAFLFLVFFLATAGNGPDASVWIALIAVIGSIAALLTPLYSNRQRRQEKIEDWRRQDEIAKRQDSKLDSINTLVDGHMTASMQATLIEMTTALALMKEVVDLKKSAKKKVSPESLAVIHHMEEKIATLSKDLAKREADAREAGLQIKTAASEAQSKIDETAKEAKSIVVNS